MPDPPPPKITRPQPGPVGRVASGAVRYAELRCRTNFSFLEGASHADELVHRTAALGYEALAITDRNSLAGVVRAHVAAKEVAANGVGLKLLIGAEITPRDAPPVVLLATDRAAYGRLSRLITLGRRRAEKGECDLALRDVLEYSEGLIACVVVEGRGLKVEGQRGVETQRRSTSPDREGGFERVARMRRVNPSLTVGASTTPLSSLNSQLSTLRSAFPGRCHLLASLHHGPRDQAHLRRLLELSRETGLPFVASNDVHYHAPERQPLHDVLTAIRHRCTVAELGHRRLPNGERHLKSPAAMAEIFAECPDAVRRTVEIAEQCTFSLDELRYEYPVELSPPGVTPFDHLVRLTWQGASERYPAGVPDDVRGRIEHELALIEQLRYEAYFLTVWDLVRFARSRRILCQGRGSAANSAVCYCLGVTAVDPAKHDLLFERFISAERNEPPDIDVDFEHERREEVLQYVYEKYGRERAGMTATVISYRPRSAIRDVGKALGLSLDTVDRLAKSVDHYWGSGSRATRIESPKNEERGARSEERGLSPTSPDREGGIHATSTSNAPKPSLTVGASRPQPSTLNPQPNSLEARFRECGLDPTSRTGRQLVLLVGELLGFPRHLSQHTGGMVMTNGRLDELVPVENASMPDRTVVQWDKDDLDAIGLLKVDCLALGMLTAIRKAFDCGLRSADCGMTSLAPTVREGLEASLADAACSPPSRSGLVASSIPHSALPTPHSPDPIALLARVPPEDPAVYEMIQQADTIGVFQIESRAQMSMLPRLKPARFYDLVIEVAIVRPGPIQGDMVHPYLRRRNGEEDVEYPDDRVKSVLDRTLGVPIFQEQAMKLAVVAAGFTPGEADQLRRAMGAWRKNGALERFRTKLVDGMTANGYDAEFAERVYNQIRGFGEYGFPESHAASFALLVYVSAWLKRHHPAAFCCGLLNSQPMGFYAPSQLVRDARDHGVEVRPADVNASGWDCTLECGVRSAECGMEETTSPDREGGKDGSFKSDASKPSLTVGASEPIPHSAFRSPHSLRLGFRLIRGFAEADAERIVAARTAGGFESVDDFARRTGLSAAVVSRLARADAFASCTAGRREALWESLPVRTEPPLTGDLPYEEPAAELPAMTDYEQVAADYRSTTLSLRDHPLKFLRRELDHRGVLPARELANAEDDRRCRVAGLVLLRQRPSTAKGITFVTLEDETGTANLVIHPGTWERFRRVARGAQVMLARGLLQREGQVIHVVVDHLDDLTPLLADVDAPSRDFR